MARAYHLYRFGEAPENITDMTRNRLLGPRSVADAGRIALDCLKKANDFLKYKRQYLIANIWRRKRALEGDTNAPDSHDTIHRYDFAQYLCPFGSTIPVRCPPIGRDIGRDSRPR